MKKTRTIEPELRPEQLSKLHSLSKLSTKTHGDHIMEKARIIEPELITTEQLAQLLSVSKKFIETHRNRIVGALKVGGIWRYNLQLIRQRIAAGSDIVLKSK